MFKTRIIETALTTNEANIYFTNITGNTFESDNTFLSTLRALLAPRLKDGENVNLEFVSINVYPFIKEAFLESLDETINSNTIRIYNLNCTADENKSWLDFFESSFVDFFKNNFEEDNQWFSLQKVTDFYRKSFEVLCFINPTHKNVVLFVDRLTLQKLHYLQCSILAFLPWYFNPSTGISDDEMELIESLREKTPDKYLVCISKIARQYDFRTQKIKKLLCDFETSYERNKCVSIKRGIEDTLNQINMLNESIRKELQRKSELEISLLGLENKIAQTENSEIMEYFLCNKKVELEDVDTNGTMIFACADYLTYFDDEMAKRMIDNKQSYVYHPNGRNCNGFINEDDIKTLMYAVFIDQILKIKFCASYCFSLNGNVSANSGHIYSDECADCMPNPHIHFYSCMGNYHLTINELLKNRDYIGAIEQCIASCKSLNFGDSVVMTRFMLAIYGLENVNNRCIELPDGRVTTPTEAIAWLKNNGYTSEKENEDE